MTQRQGKNAQTRSGAIASLPSTLVLLGSADTDLSRRLDVFAGQSADHFDLRDGVAWLHVDDPASFIVALAQEFADEHHDSIRIALADPLATVDNLVHNALAAPTLRQHLDATADEAFRINPPAFDVHYQPISRLVDGKVVGFEALLRAKVGAETVDTEGVFQRAERGRWLGELDQLARVLALKGLGPWHNGALLFMNLAAPDGAFDLTAINTTIDLALDAGLEADQIVFEAVEHNRYNDIDAAAAQIASIRDRGVRIAIDDVGDGFASLRVLAAFKPDIVKISGNLTSGVDDANVRSVISTIVDLAHRTNAWVVAEGIEDQSQAATLQSLGCDWGQGVWLGSPIQAPA